MIEIILLISIIIGRWFVWLAKDNKASQPIWSIIGALSFGLPNGILVLFIFPLPQVEKVLSSLAIDSFTLWVIVFIFCLGISYFTYKLLKRKQLFLLKTTKHHPDLLDG